WFWVIRVYWTEARQWYAALLAADDGVPRLVRAQVLHHSAVVEGFLLDFGRGKAFAEEALQLARAATDKWNTAWSLAALGFLGINFIVDEVEAIAGLEEAVALFRELGDAWGTGHAVRRLAYMLLKQGKSERAIELGEGALVLARAAGAKSAVA